MLSVFINPGHSNVDPGAVSPNGIKEADIVLIVGELVKENLCALGYDVHLLQDDSLGNIVNEANVTGSDIFVSIHCNAANTPNAYGAETFHSPGSAYGEKLARYIQQQLIGNVPVANRGVKTATFYVLKYTDMPAVLVELAFLSNQYDESILTEPKRQREFAKAITLGITDYFLEVG